MRLLIHNILSSKIKGVTNGFPLTLEVVKFVEKEADFNPSFLKHLFLKIEWKALVDAARSMNYAELPEKADSSLLDSDNFLKKFHHAVLELHLEEGALICPETGRRFPVSKGIPNMQLHEDEGTVEGIEGDGNDYSGYFPTTEVFDTDLKAIDSAKSIAIILGFELVICSHKNGGKRKILRCACGLPYRGAKRDMNVAIRKNTKTKSCNCNFSIKVYQLEGASSWGIGVFPGIRGMHNHRLTIYPEGYRQMNGLSSASKKIVREMTLAQAKPCAILAAVQEQNPEDRATKRHVYNYRDRLRRDNYEDKDDVVYQFHHLALKHKYVHWTNAEPETHVITNVFMAHPQSVNLLRTYPWFIGMDSTYKTNRYNMSLFQITGMTPANKKFLIAYVIMKDETEISYRWVLDKLRILIGYDVHPTVIVTDRELGLMRPISELFPQTAHLLCTWHINKDVEDQVYSLCNNDKDFAEQFKNSKWRRIMEARDVHAYDYALMNLRDSMRYFPLVIAYVEGTWLVHKEKFVKAWTNNVLHFGNTTTCRVEGAHAQLKGWMDSSTDTLDTVWTKVHQDIEHQLSQIRYTLEECSRKVGVETCNFPLNYLACHVSHHCLALLTDEIIRMRDLGDHVIHICGCVMRNTYQIPCACELKRAMDSGTPISVERIHMFWRTLKIDEGSRKMMV